MFPELLPYGDLGMYALRLAVGLVFLVHGWPKVAKPAGMAKNMGWSKYLVIGLGTVESLSALALILGVYAQLGALLLAVVMVGALYHKLFVWKLPFSASGKSGWELELVLLTAALAIATAPLGLYGLM